MRTVSVTAPARLHLGFLDLNGSRGRRFGSVGLTLEGPCVELSVQRAPRFSVAGSQAERAAQFAKAVCRRFNFPDHVQLTIAQTVPEHVGLGSGTQLGIAVGVALSKFHGHDIPVRQIATTVQRGQRSGIGAAAFELGGFLVDGGKGPTDDPPPIISRIEFPTDWRIVLVLERAARGLHGELETAAFQALPEFPETMANYLCRLMLMQALPALVEHDIDRFGNAIGELQRITGDYFSPAQGGRFFSPVVAEALGWIASHDIAGVGQSSWGPTGFAIVGSAERANELVNAANERWGNAGPLQFAVCRGRNRGGDVASSQSAAASVKIN
ncbi:MAG TPA: beta-ribofuranosylaminobenzene 5'-phosphate synthase family protein [Burkholderiales bacterium]|nr:beta-ribofuranosylaminobenzene 5'-phosphate synthase family protein [Burkholderiales bacterium]